MKTTIERNKGFTLIELMIIIVVLGMLVAVGLPRFTSFLEEGRIAATIEEMNAIKSAAKLYQLNTREYPRTVRDLIEAPAWIDPDSAEQKRKNIRWDGPYMDGDYDQIGYDAWGNEYGIYYNESTTGNNGVVVVSGGPFEFDVTGLSGDVDNSGDDSEFGRVIHSFVRFDGVRDLFDREDPDTGTVYGEAFDSINILSIGEASS